MDSGERDESEDERQTQNLNVLILPDCWLDFQQSVYVGSACCIVENLSQEQVSGSSRFYQTLRFKLDHPLFTWEKKQTKIPTIPQTKPMGRV